MLRLGAGEGANFPALTAALSQGRGNAHDHEVTVVLPALWSWFKPLLRSPYWHARRLLETRVLGSAVSECIWRSRHWFKPPPLPAESATHPHRPQILGAIARFEPFESLLEAGCNTGANLYLLARAYPEARFLGVDINPRAVDAGRKAFESYQMANVSLGTSPIDSLARFETGSVDVVLSDAVLMFVGPDKIGAALQEMARVARKGLVLNEYASPEPPPGNYDGGRFVYDYWRLLPSLVPGAQLRAEKSTFAGADWDRYGWLFTVDLTSGDEAVTTRCVVRDEVSMIVATYNRPGDLADCLASILQQTHLPGELIVVDNGRGLPDHWVAGRTAQFSRRGVRLAYLKNDHGNSLTVARNLGFRQSRGDFVLYVDDDVVLEPTYLEQLLRVYDEHPDAVGVHGYIQRPRGRPSRMGNLFGRVFLLGWVARDNCRLLPSLGTTYPFPLTRVTGCTWLSGANHSYRRAVLERISYDEQLMRYAEGEDIDHSHRVFKAYQGGLYITPHAKLWHRVSREGRLPTPQLTLLCEVYSLHVFFKLNPPAWKLLLYGWSRFGKLLWWLGRALAYPSRDQFNSALHLVRAYVYCCRHLSRLRSGDLDFFNATLS